MGVYEPVPHLVHLFSMQEIVAVSSVNKKEIGRCFKLILKALETTVDIVTTNDFMFRFCSNLGITNKVGALQLSCFCTSIN